jgi:hypothetical protein
MNLRESARELLPSVFDSFLVALALELGQFCIQGSFFPQQMISPYIRLENGIQRDSVVANNLHAIVIADK